MSDRVDTMNIGFLLSACIWSWIVGRCIAFGPTCTVFTWIPKLPPDSWYHLTNIPFKMPRKLIVCMPFMLTALSVPGLMINNTIVHSIVVLCMVNEQCYIPIFTTRIYDSITTWPLVTAIANILLALTIRNTVVFATLYIKAVCFAWFAWIEFSIRHTLVREELPYQERHPRTV